MALLGHCGLPAVEMRHQWMRNLRDPETGSPWVDEEGNGSEPSAATS